MPMSATRASLHRFMTGSYFSTVGVSACRTSLTCELVREFVCNALYWIELDELLMCFVRMAEEKVQRRKRLRRWLEAVSLQSLSLTGLLPDILMIVGEFAVPLEHMWGVLPHNYRRPMVSECCKTLSTTVSSCNCRTWICQHFCSIYTIDQSGASEFSINLKAKEFWWAGVLWSSGNDGLQLSPPDAFPAGDSMRLVPDIFACFLDYRGRLCTFSSAGPSVQSSLLDLDGLASMELTITIKVRSTGTRQIIEFQTPQSQPSMLWTEKSRVSGLFCRPFVQFERGRSLSGPYFLMDSPYNGSRATITTPLF